MKWLELYGKIFLKFDVEDLSDYFNRNKTSMALKHLIEH